MPQGIWHAMNVHSQHWEPLMAKNPEIVLMKIQKRPLELAVMHVT